MALKRTAKEEEGFTLIEFLVAMVMLAIIMPALTLSFGSAMKASERIDQRSANSSEARAVLSVITKDLENAYLPITQQTATQSLTGDSDTAAQTGTTPAIGWFTGADSASGSAPADSLSFTTLSGRADLSTLSQDLTPADTDQPMSAFQQVTYSLQPGIDGSSGVLVRSWASPPGQDSTATTNDDQLSDRVIALNFEYFDGTEWSDSWDTTQADPTADESTDATLDGTEPVTTESLLPIAVRVTLGILGDDGPHTYTTTVSLPLFHSSTYTIEQATTTANAGGGSGNGGSNNGGNNNGGNNNGGNNGRNGNTGNPGNGRTPPAMRPRGRSLPLMQSVPAPQALPPL
jgi:prepilin-type N-terminal cleavage/methylation domain-containing protein